jgi:hypothetical protein
MTQDFHFDDLDLPKEDKKASGLAKSQKKRK